MDLGERLFKVIGDRNDEQLAEISGNDSSPPVDERLDNAGGPDNMLLLTGALHFNPHPAATNH